MEKSQWPLNRVNKIKENIQRSFSKAEDSKNAFPSAPLFQQQSGSTVDRNKLLRVIDATKEDKIGVETTQVIGGYKVKISLIELLLDIQYFQFQIPSW